MQIYHAKGEGQVYSLFVVLLDADEPWKVVKRGTRPLLAPQAAYETDGFFGNVIFSNGQVVEEDGRVLVYYGAADECTCLLEATVEDLRQALN